MLIAVPISVKLVLEKTIVKSGAEIDTGAVYSHRIIVEEEARKDAQPFYIRYLPEIGGVLVFMWLVAVFLFLGYVRKNKKED